MNLFKRIVLEEIEKEYRKLEKDYLNKEKIELLTIEKKAEEKSKVFVDKFILKAKTEQEQVLIETKKRSKEKILTLKNLLIEEVYESVLKKAEIFVKEEEYFSILKRLINLIKLDMKEFKSLKVYLTKYDYKNNNTEIKNMFNKNLSEFNIEFLESDDDFLGGFIVFNSDKTIKVDISIKTIITRRKRFIGNEVYKLLDKAGVKND